MDNNALLSALLKFQAWCVDNESLLRENSYLQERLANAHAALDDWKAVADKATDELGEARRKLAKAENLLESLRSAAEPFANIGRVLAGQLEDHWCSHYDHFVGDYRKLAAAMDAIEETR